jgi:hypothetical protein
MSETSQPPPPQPPPAAPAEVKSIFMDLADLSPAERAAELERRCGHDPNLRDAVRSLLDASDRAGAFFAGPTAAGQRLRATLPAAFEEAPKQIGPYKILQEIGEGGFGTVYMAEQESPVRRRVALKLIK